MACHFWRENSNVVKISPNEIAYFQKNSTFTVGAMSFFTFIVALAMLSVFPHQEPRFLIPLTVPLVMMNAPKLRWKFCNRKPLLTLWFAFNIVCAIFFGFVHQAGVMPATNYIAEDLQLRNVTNEANFVWSHTYMPPTFKLLRISDRSRRRKEKLNENDFPSYFLRQNVRMNFHDLSGKDIFSDVRRELNALATRAKLKKGTVENFVIIPNHLVEDLQEATEETLKLDKKAVFCPHISTENPPNVVNDLHQVYMTILESNPQAFISSISGLFENFCLALIKFESLTESISTVQYMDAKKDSSSF